MMNFPKMILIDKSRDAVLKSHKRLFDNSLLVLLRLEVAPGQQRY